MKYKFAGNGVGVPGLPHVITDTQAKELGVEEILKQAVKAGTMTAEKKPTKKKE
jgi:hypothetical protein